jgi:hypothetical protein
MLQDSWTSSVHYVEISMLQDSWTSSVNYKQEPTWWLLDPADFMFGGVITMACQALQCSSSLILLPAQVLWHSNLQYCCHCLRPELSKTYLRVLEFLLLIMNAVQQLKVMTHGRSNTTRSQHVNNVAV